MRRCLAGSFFVRNAAHHSMANWAFDFLLTAIYAELPVAEAALKQLLEEGRSVSTVDLRSLSAERFVVLLAALRQAIARIERAGAGSFSEPAFFNGFLERANELLSLMHGDRRAISTSPPAPSGPSGSA